MLVVEAADMEELEITEKLEQARVAVAGLGGLGSHIAAALVRTGVKHLHLVDFDLVDESNLNRQHYMRSHIGRYKTEALKEQLLAIHPDADIRIDTVKVTEDNIAALFADADIVCEAFDKPDAKAMLVEGVLCGLPDVKLISGSGMAGWESSNLIKTRKINNRFYLCGDEKTGIEDGVRLTAGRVAICAGHEANMAVRLILGLEEA